MARSVPKNKICLFVRYLQSFYVVICCATAGKRLKAPELAQPPISALDLSKLFRPRFLSCRPVDTVPTNHTGMPDLHIVPNRKFVWGATRTWGGRFQRFRTQKSARNATAYDANFGFGISHSLEGFRDFSLRMSNPKPHEEHIFAKVPSNPKLPKRLRPHVANLGFGILAVHVCAGLLSRAFAKWPAKTGCEC
jgi:hypothetical protein